MRAHLKTALALLLGLALNLVPALAHARRAAPSQTVLAHPRYAAPSRTVRSIRDIPDWRVNLSHYDPAFNLKTKQALRLAFARFIGPRASTKVTAGITFIRVSRGSHARTSILRVDTSDGRFALLKMDRVGAGRSFRLVPIGAAFAHSHS